jgi:hypothetical protein
MQAKPAQDKPGGITTTQLAAHAQFLAQRQALIADLIRLAEIFNPDSLPEQYEAYASEKYGLCMSHAETARTKVTDNESLAAMTAVSQELRASLVNDIGTFTYMRRIAERDIVQGEIVQSEQRAITSGNAPDYDYGDDDTDDYDDTPRVEFAPSGAGLQVLGVIIIAGVIVYGIWRGWEAYLDSEVPIKCEGKHVISRPSATRIVQGANYGTIINDGNGYYCCPKHTDNGSQYLTDAFGYPGTVYIDSESGPYSETRRNKRNRKASNTNSAIPPSGIAN